MDRLRSFLSAWLAGLSWRGRLTGGAVVLLICVAVGVGIAHAVRGSGPVRLAAAPTSTRVPATPTPTLAPDAPSPTPAPPTATPAPTATLGAIAGISSRTHIYPPNVTPDLTLGSASVLDLHSAHSVVYTPDPRYVAEDTLTDTGPGPPGPLSGLPTMPELAKRRPVAVVIDNFAPDARPQAGLNRASLVFETLAEGGITRFMAVFLEKDAPIVGPVRSARIYFDSWADGLHAVYGHAGGNNDALAELPKLSALDNVDGLSLSAPNPFPWDLYWRSGDRAAPHNFYTATAHLRDYANATTHDASPPITALPHKEPAAIFVRPAGGWIHVTFSMDSYNVQYRYNPHCNCYPRSMDTVPHIDEFSLRQIAPSNVVVLYAGVLPDPASDTPGSINVQSRGFGKALFFRDGTEVEGRWHKSQLSDALELLDVNGQPMPLNPGQTWIEVVPLGSSVQWQLHS